MQTQCIAAMQQLCGLQRTLARMMISGQAPALSQSFSSEPHAIDAAENPPRLKIKRGSHLYHMHMTKRSAWRREMNQRLQQWRAEIVQQHQQQLGGGRDRAPAGLDGALHVGSGARTHQQVLKQLSEELRQAELDAELVSGLLWLAF